MPGRWEEAGGASGPASRDLAWRERRVERLGPGPAESGTAGACSYARGERAQNVRLCGGLTVVGARNADVAPAGRQPSRVGCPRLVGDGDEGQADEPVRVPAPQCLDE